MLFFSICNMYTMYMRLCEIVEEFLEVTVPSHLSIQCNDVITFLVFQLKLQITFAYFKSISMIMAIDTVSVNIE